MSLIDPQFEFLSTAPTFDFDSFAKNFRFIAKHPLRISTNVSKLPRQEETCRANLPFINGHEPKSDSNLAYDQTKKLKKYRGRDNIDKSEIKLKNFFWYQCYFHIVVITSISSQYEMLNNNSGNLVLVEVYCMT